MTGCNNNLLTVSLIKDLVDIVENALNLPLNKLPDPPMVRENLKREILLFAEMLRQKAEEDGRLVLASKRFY